MTLRIRKIEMFSAGINIVATRRFVKAQIPLQVKKLLHFFLFPYDVLYMDSPMVLHATRMLICYLYTAFQHDLLKKGHFKIMRIYFFFIRDGVFGIIRDRKTEK